tara:strand:- start:516 stop:722 length:207 start_codon:yes stop_codon:yes gene_type:complete
MFTITRLEITTVIPIPFRGNENTSFASIDVAIWPRIENALNQKRILRVFDSSFPHQGIFSFVANEPPA